MSSTKISALPLAWLGEASWFTLTLLLASPVKSDGVSVNPIKVLLLPDPVSLFVIVMVLFVLFELRVIPDPAINLTLSSVLPDAVAPANVIILSLPDPAPDPVVWVSTFKSYFVSGICVLVSLALIVNPVALVPVIFTFVPAVIVTGSVVESVPVRVMVALPFPKSVLSVPPAGNVYVVSVFGIWVFWALIVNPPLPVSVILILSPAVMTTASVVESVPVKVIVAEPLASVKFVPSVPVSGKVYSVFTFVWPAIVIVLFVISWVREIAFPAIILMSSLLVVPVSFNLMIASSPDPLPDDVVCWAVSKS